MKQIVVLLDNIRSAHNVGSLLRTADGMGVSKVVMCGITPYPSGSDNDERLPHVASGAHKLISKTSLGAENSVEWEYEKDIFNAISRFRSDGFHIISIEQDKSAVTLENFSRAKNSEKIVIVLGHEVDGVNKKVLKMSDQIVEIPMHGTKESFNVSIAGALAMYELAKA